MQPYEIKSFENPTYLFVSCPGAEPVVVALEVNNSLFAGSGSNCGIVLRGIGVEPIHCMFWMNEERIVRVQDWNTKTGLTINGQSANTETTLASGDELKIGENRIVAVLSIDVHVRLSGAPAHPDSTPQSTFKLPANKLKPEDRDLADIHHPSAGEINTPSESFSVQTNVEVDIEQSANSELPGFEYDVLADLDSVELEDDGSAVGFGGEFAEYGRSAEFDESRDEEMELLRMEIDQLRFELAERDAPSEAFREPSCEHETAVDDDQTIQLVSRLEDLLEELQASDDRVRGLEDMLRASDQATQAERDERRQLESWVTEIEQRVAERESESDAELIRVKNRLEEVTARHKQTQVQLKKVLQSKTASGGGDSIDLIHKFREQVEELEHRLEASTTEIDQLRRQAVGGPDAGQAHEELKEMEQRLLQQQVDTARERAEMSRQRAELELLKGELEEKLRSTKNTGNGDARLSAMRQHLREIHEEEKIEREAKRQRSLGGRISRLLGATGR